MLNPALNALTTPVFLVDADRTLLFANTTAQTLFGTPHIGGDFVQTLRHPDCLAVIDKVLAGAKSADTVLDLQHPVRTTFRVTVTSLRPTSSQALISFDNISHILDAQQMRSEFVANVSHELRSPLTALSGFIETLQTTAKDDAQAQARFLDIMAGEASRMDRLIGDLLSLSRVEANKHIRPGANISARRIVAQAVTVLGKLSKAHDCPITLKTPDGLDGLNDTVQGDEDQLLQVFLNLIENAVKYGSTDKGVVVTMSNVGNVAGIEGAALSVVVSDFGTGIAAEHLPRLTERFYRVDEGRSREKGGTGLGLAIVKHILTRHQGRLQIASTAHKGSQFTVLLPLATR